MALIAFDNSGKGDNGGSGTISQSFTIAGANPILIVFVGHNNAITSITYGGVALTRMAQKNSASYGTSELWYLIGPLTGANTLVITGTTFMTAAWASYKSIKQSGFPDSQSSQDPATPASPISGSTTSVANNCWIIGGFYTAFNVGFNFAAGSSTTLRQSNQYNSAGTLYTAALVDSNAAKSPGSNSVAVTYTGVAPGDVANIMASLEPGPDGGGILALL